jgi:hypothetical protein
MANQYLTFAATAIDTFTPTAWASMTGLLTNGFQTGIADTTDVNTLMRQLSVPVSAIGQYISDAGFDANDDGVRANFQTALANALKKNLLASDQGAWIQDKGGVNRFFFGAAGGTFIQGQGTTPLIVRDSTGAQIAAFNSNGRVAAGADAASGLDLITYQQWAAGNNQYTNIINIPGNRSSTYYMTTAEYGSLVVINDGFAFNVVLPTAVGAAGKIVRIYNNARSRSIGVFTPNAPTELLYGPGLELDYSYAGAPDYCGGNIYLEPRQDYEFISDGTNWITLAGASLRIQGYPNVITRAAYVGGTTSYTIRRRQTRVLKVTLVGGGGGGGGNGGGGSGAVLITHIYDPAVLSTTPAFTFTVGAGGTRGPIQGTNGGATTLSFSAGIPWTYTAGGGFAGAGQQGGAGGVGSITGLSHNEIILRGNPGGNGTPGDTSLPGTGGAAPLFGGGGCGTLNGTATRDGINGGGGAGGGLSAAAGLGGDGFIMFEEF